MDAFYQGMEQKVQEQLVKDWGEAPGEVMEYNGDILVPGTMNGNVFVTVQPPRGFGEDPEKIYHDPFVAPTHQYLAFYRWIRDVWQADAVAHIGTHGNLEWLPGKNAGLSSTCYPDLSLGDLPNIYPYNISITGEGIQAKRRGAACLIEHLPAPQTQAGVYDELEELEKLMEEYIHFETTQPENLPNLEQMLKEKVAAVSPKPQTTRNAVRCIYTSEDEQIVFVDTPGIHVPQHALGDFMMKEAEESLMLGRRLLCRRGAGPRRERKGRDHSQSAGERLTARRAGRQQDRQAGGL